MTLQVNHLQLLSGNKQMICIKTEIPEEICEIDDELKALNEFCSINQYNYEVIAISFFTKQVAVKLIGI